MNRTSLATGIIIPALLAVVPACDDPFTCPGVQVNCGSVCVDLAADDLNCGACGTECPTGESCVQRACVPDLVCNAPEMACGGACVEVQTSEQHCGACDVPCSAFGDCLAGDCAEPLAAIQTVFETKGTIDRDLHILQDITFSLTRLNDTTATGARVVDHAVLPDGRVLLVAAQQEDVFELWLASPRGGGLTRVNGTLATDGDVLPGIVVSRDGRRVLYRADQDTDGVIDLYSVALATPGTSRRINGVLTTGGEVSRVFALSADGNRAAYIADQDTDDLDEAYTVDLSAGGVPGPSVKLNAPITTSVWDLALSLDGSRVVYRAPVPVTGNIELLSVSVANPGQPSIIPYAESATGNIESYRISADGTAVFFTGGASFLDESLWRASLTVQADAVRLVDAGDYEWVRPDFVVSPDGSRVYFRKVSGAFGFDRLFRVDVATPLQPVQLSPAGDTSAEEVTDFVLADDGRSIVYRGGADGAEGSNYQPGTDVPFIDSRRAPALYHIDLTVAAPPTPTPLNDDFSLGAEGIADGYIVAGDGTRVIYRADHDVTYITDAYLVALETAGTVRKVSPPLDGGSQGASDVARLTRF